MSISATKVTSSQECIAQGSAPSACNTASGEGIFHFINFTLQSEAETSRNRKKIRSFVTKRQHQRKRLLGTEFVGRDSEDEAMNRSSSRKAPVQSVLSKPTSPAPMSCPPHESKQGGICSIPDSRLSPRIHNYSTKDQSSQLSGSERGWHAYWVIISGENLSMPADEEIESGKNEQRFLKPERYLSLHPETTVSRDVTILMIASFGQKFDLRSKPAEMLYLKTKAIEGIKTALADNALCTADHTVAAVAQMAAYEVLFGDSCIGRIHMQGLKCIIHLRGGLVNLGMAGLLEEFILWIDCNISCIFGGPTFLDEKQFPTSSPHIRHPNPNLDEFGYNRYCSAQLQLGNWKA